MYKHETHHAHHPHHEAQHPYQHRSTSRKKLLIGILIGLFVIAGVVIAGQNNAFIKGLFIPQIKTPKIYNETTGNVSVLAEPIIGSSSERTITAGDKIAKFKITNQGDSDISFNTVGLRYKGFTAGTVNYKLLISKENAADSVEASAKADQDNLNFSFDSPIIISKNSHRYITLQIEKARGLEKGDAFTFTLEQIGKLELNPKKPATGIIIKK